MSQKRVSSRFSLHRFYLADGCFGSNVFRLCPPILLMRVQRAGGHGSALCFGGAFSVRPRGPLTCPGTTGAFLLRRGRSARGRHSPRPRPPRLRPARRDGGRAERSSPGSLYTIARLFLGALQVTPAGAGSPVSGKCAPSKSWDGFSLGRGPRGPSATQARAADSCNLLKMKTTMPTPPSAHLFSFSFPFSFLLLSVSFSLILPFPL